MSWLKSQHGSNKHNKNYSDWILFSSSWCLYCTHTLLGKNISPPSWYVRWVADFPTSRIRWDMWSFPRNSRDYENQPSSVFGLDRKIRASFQVGGTLTPTFYHPTPRITLLDPCWTPRHADTVTKSVASLTEVDVVGVGATQGWTDLKDVDLFMTFLSPYLGKYNGPSWLNRSKYDKDTPLKINILNMIRKVWFRSFSFKKWVMAVGEPAVNLPGCQHIFCLVRYLEGRIFIPPKNGGKESGNDPIWRRRLNDFSTTSH